MAIVRPFRGLRAVPARVDPGALTASGVDVDDAEVAALITRDPRNVMALLKANAHSRARFLLQEQMRAGIVARDRLPALYVLKVQGEGGNTGFFAVVRADSLEVDAVADLERTEHLRLTAVGIEPVVVSYLDKNGRVARALQSETEREPDAAFAVAGKPCELWALDDDSVAARVTAVLEGQTLTATRGALAIAAQKSLVSGDDAIGYTLAFFVDGESPVELVPIGIVLHALDGSL